jgi:fido (protein-threonine AMPylation protein)
MAQAASAFYAFLQRQNPKGYILTHGDLKEWHRKFFKDIVLVPYYAGNYRRIDQNKPCLNKEVEVNGVFGAPARDVESRMKKFSEALGEMTNAADQYLKTPRSLVLRVQTATQIAAYAGGSIIQIHPFLNGNGRIARMAMNFFLHRYLDRIPFYVDRPANPDYSRASAVAMQTGNFIPLYQYLIELLATLP